MQPLINDATTALLRAIRANFLNFAPDCTLRFDSIRSRPWASVTFSGARHELMLSLAGPSAVEAGGRLPAILDVAEFKLRGHILADIVLIATQPGEGAVQLSLEALTVEE